MEFKKSVKLFEEEKQCLKLAKNIITQVCKGFDDDCEYCPLCEMCEKVRLSVGTDIEDIFTKMVDNLIK